MKKIPYPQYQVNVYEEVLPNKMRLIVIPNEENSVRLGVYVEAGTYSGLEKIGNTKIPSGVSKVLSLALLKDDIVKVIEKEKSTISVSLADTNTYYSVNTVSDYHKSLDYLLAMTCNFDLTEADVEKAKVKLLKEKQEYLECPFNASLEALKGALYIGSPIKDSMFASDDNIKSIHLSTLKKYYQYYYTLDKMTLFVFGNVDPLEVSKYMQSLKFVNVFPQLSVEKKKYEESYGSSAKTTLDITHKNVTNPILTVGYKFIIRQQLFESYRNDLFGLYEIIPSYLFGETSDFVIKMKEQNLIERVVRADIIEGSEDAFLYVQFETLNPSLLKRDLYEYGMKMDKMLDKKNLSNVVKEYYGKSVRNLGSSKTLEKHMVRAFGNHITYPSLIDIVKSMKPKNVKDFTKEISSCPTSIVITKVGE